MDEDNAIATFTSITGASPQEARQYLAANAMNLDAAVSMYYTSREEELAVPEDEQDNDDDHDDIDDPDYDDVDMSEVLPAPNQSAPSGGRRLGDAPTDPQPIPVASSSSSSAPKKNPPTQKKFATLGDINSGASHSHGDDDDEDDHKQDLFTGGEKSGLAVQNPDDIKKKILEKAMKKKVPPKTDEKPRPSHFNGPAQTLGGDEAPSRAVAQPMQAPSRAERVDRVLHFWNDGFSVDDGDLFRSDDPRNAEILNGIRQGRAPLSIMNVSPGQEVDVEIKQHQENYVKPKKKWVPFAGHGNRLGSPTPGTTTMPGSFTQDSTPESAAVTAATPSAAASDVDESQPVITLRVSLGTGARLPARFNASHTIGDVYAFAQRADPTPRQFVLQTTMPTKEFTDMSQKLGDVAELKRGGVVVQKYV